MLANVEDVDLQWSSECKFIRRDEVVTEKQSTMDIQ